MLSDTVRRARLRLANRISGAIGPPTDTQEGRNYRNLVIGGALLGLHDGGALSYLPVFLARLGASPTVVGLLTTGPALVGILSYIPGGIYAQRRTGQVRMVITTGLVARSLVYLLFALFPFFVPLSLLPALIIAIWSLTSVPIAVHMAAWTTVMHKAISPRLRPKLNGTRWGLLASVSAVALSLLGAMLDRTAFPGGYQLVFLISGAAVTANYYVFNKVRTAPFVPPQSQVVAGASLAQRLRAFFRPIAESPAFVRYNVATIGFRLGINMPLSLLSIFWVNELHATDTWIGLRGTVGYAALVVGYNFWGRMASRLGHRNILLVGGGLFALYPALTALAPSVEWLLPAAVIWGFTAGAIDIGLFDMLLAACPEGRQPSFSAVANMLSSVAAAVGPLLGAALAGALGIRAALFIISGILVLTTLCFFLLPNREQEGLHAAG